MPEEKLGRDVQETWGLGRDGVVAVATRHLGWRWVELGVRRQLWVDGPGREAILADGRESAGIGGFCGADAGQMSKVGD
jgi:hypothetical protein